MKRLMKVSENEMHNEIMNGLQKVKEELESYNFKGLDKPEHGNDSFDNSPIWYLILVSKWLRPSEQSMRDIANKHLSHLSDKIRILIDTDNAKFISVEVTLKED